MTCATCLTKWFFDEHHQRLPDIDMTACGACGGPLVPLVEERAGEAPAGD